MEAREVLYASRFTLFPSLYDVSLAFEYNVSNVISVELKSFRKSFSQLVLNTRGATPWKATQPHWLHPTQKVSRESLNSGDYKV